MRLIDVDAAIEAIKDALPVEGENNNTKLVLAYGMGVAMSELKAQPTIDAVPVVRCKDCIYWWESHEMCMRNKDKNHNCACMNCDADFFCKNGERRTDG